MPSPQVQFQPNANQRYTLTAIPRSGRTDATQMEVRGSVFEFWFYKYNTATACAQMILRAVVLLFPNYNVVKIHRSADVNCTQGGVCSPAHE